MLLIEQRIEDLHLGGHLILGLPGETKEDMLNHARKVSNLPINTLKNTSFANCKTYHDGCSV